MTEAFAMSTLPQRELERIRRTRRHPVRTQPDYLILRFLVLHLEHVLGEIRHPVDDVLDLWCGTQPYRDLVPPHRRYVAMDIDDRYGTPDVVSDEFLPFPDDSFDLILFTEAFHYLTDPRAGMEELARVLRPGGTLVLTVPLVWEYDRRIVERRYTGPQLAELFADWDDVWVMENGGYAVAWATLTGRILRGFHEALPAPAQRLLRPMFAAAAYAVNVVATMLTRIEPRWHEGPFILPMGLLVRARRPSG
jgi:SAM-dependent methyltransferase